MLSVSGSQQAMGPWAVLLGVLSLLFSGQRLAAEQPQPALAEVRIELNLKGQPVAPLAGVLTLRPAAGGPPLVLPIADAKLVTPLPANTSWEASVNIPGYWGRRENVAVGSPGSGLVQRIALWPLGRISGSIQGTPKPKEVRVVTLAPRRPLPKDDQIKGTMVCPVDGQGIWSCELPAAVFDFYLSVKGFAPRYAWDVEVPPAASVDLGPLLLAPGSSVAGWVEVGSLDSTEGCIARLLPLETADGWEAVTASSDATKVQSNGFFQLTGVKPGEYVLEVQAPGHEPARLSPIRVSPGSEQLLDRAFVLRPSRSTGAKPSPS